MDPFLSPYFAPFVHFLVTTLQAAAAAPLGVKLLAALFCLSALCTAGVLAATLRHGQQRADGMEADLEEEAAAWRSTQRAAPLARAAQPVTTRLQL